MVEVEVKDTATAQIVAAGLMCDPQERGFSVQGPGLEAFGQDRGWIFTVDDEQAAVIREVIGEE